MNAYAQDEGRLPGCSWDLPTPPREIDSRCDPAGTPILCSCYLSHSFLEGTELQVILVELHFAFVVYSTVALPL